MVWLGLVLGGISGALLFVHYGYHALWFTAGWALLLTVVQWCVRHTIAGRGE